MCCAKIYHVVISIRSISTVWHRGYTLKRKIWNKGMTDARRSKKEPMSKTRKAYWIRLIFRVFVLIGMVMLYFLMPEQLEILHGRNFFRQLSILHIVWLIWVVDMVWQLIPVGKNISLGSQKLFKQRFKPIREKINHEALRNHIITTTKAAYKVFILWFVLILAIGVLYFFDVLSAAHLFLISVFFYVCDLICVLIWCPFRLIMKNRCCTTCRIFNWDHLMMFTPMLFINSFYSVTLLLMAFAVWVLWELCVMMYPERFWEQSNASLKCSECTDKLCTQYCRKLRELPKTGQTKTE